MNSIAEMNYPDFVAFIEQENTPPLGEVTVAAWQEMASNDASSKVLDWACSTRRHRRQRRPHAAGLDAEILVGHPRVLVQDQVDPCGDSPDARTRLRRTQVASPADDAQASLAGLLAVG